MVIWSYKIFHDFLEILSEEFLLTRLSIGKSYFVNVLKQRNQENIICKNWFKKNSSFLL